MKLLAIFVLYKEDDGKVKVLQDEFNLGSFGYFERYYVKQLLVFSARTITERTALCTRQSVEADQNVNGIVHVYVRPDGLASVIISDSEYPQRVAHILLSKVMNDFTTRYPSASCNPQEADPLMRLEKDLDDTKDILIKTMINVLDRGENLDDLFARSHDLSSATKEFAKTARRKNQCCTLF
ncbi:unnamed protein product [Rotaria sordida]|uniref:Uncharacterized protein n=1 Tax=Rotaria sordida TaxID=392033 RepID=A0A819DQT7_9BILA|nr:unnamed protein product [Rotaria sordida]